MHESNSQYCAIYMQVKVCFSGNMHFNLVKRCFVYILFCFLFYVFELEKLEIFDLLFQKGLMAEKKESYVTNCITIHDNCSFSPISN